MTCCAESQTPRWWVSGQLGAAVVVHVARVTKCDTELVKMALTFVTTMCKHNTEDAAMKYNVQVSGTIIIYLVTH